MRKKDANESTSISFDSLLDTSKKVNDSSNKGIKQDKEVKEVKEPVIKEKKRHIKIRGNKEKVGQETPEQSTQEPVKRQRKKGKKTAIIACVLLVIGIAMGYYLHTQDKEYDLAMQEATEAYKLRDYEKAYMLFMGADKYDIKSSGEANELATQCLTDMSEVKYKKAVKFMNSGKHKIALEIFSELGNYKDSAKLKTVCTDVLRFNYVESTGRLIYKINKYKELSSFICLATYDAWSVAEQSGANQTVAINKTKGQYANQINALQIGNAGLTEQLSRVLKMGGAEQVYDMTHDLFNKYNELHQQAVNPTGTVLDYGKKINDYSKEFDATLEKLCVAEPTIRNTLNEEKLKEDLETAAKAKAASNIQ